MPHRYDTADAASSTGRGGDERDLVRDTLGYLDEHARGLIPSARQREAWERFFRLGNAVIRHSARVRKLNGGDRDDCEQDFWADVIAELGRARYDPGRAGLRTWLSALARNKCTDVIRRRTRRHPCTLDDATLTSLTSREHDAAWTYEHHQERALVHRALGILSQLISDCSYRVLVLRAIDELEVSEVAAALGVTPEQVRYRHCRAKYELRRLVETIGE